MSGRLHLLVVDDDCGFIEDFQLLSKDVFRVSTAETGEAAIVQLEKAEPDALILDLCLGDGIDGLELLKEIGERHSDLPVIMVTEHASVETAVAAMKLGAVHYMSKHPNMKALHAIIERELSRNQWKRLYRETIESQFGEIVGESDVMQAVYHRIDRVAATKVNILIEGENGTGKELVAREIHKRSRQNEKPFVAVNCAAIPSTLFESELFGFERGAFTGAERRKRGRFEQAHGGTIFLDEIIALSYEMQAKLLRVIEERSFTRLGGTEPIDVDVRILSATNRPLGQEVRRGTFREDLYHRLNGIDIQVPPLRDRGDDILMIADYFSRQFGVHSSLEHRFSSAALEMMRHYAWPGNVRELRNVMERVHILVVNRLVERQDLQLEQEGDPDTPKVFRDVLMHPYEQAKTEIMARFKGYYLSALIERHAGNVNTAAREAGLPRQSLYRMMNE